MKQEQIKTLLKKYAFRATPGRVALIEALAKSKSPESIDDLTTAVSGNLDSANVYRALESFVKAAFVHKSDFHDGKSYYELMVDRHHHHHIVCTSCGTIEDVSACADTLEKTTLKKSQKFSAIADHSLEFFGVCRMCEKAS